MTCHIILYEPQIPPNTGNIMRLCSNTNSQLHIIHPCGFDFDDHKLKRAGLDYREWTEIKHHENWEAFIKNHPDMTLWLLSTKGSIPYDQVTYGKGDGFVFGPETRGLPESLRKAYQAQCYAFLWQSVLEA